MDQPADTVDEVWTATGHEPPVFLDEHGHRRRWVLLGGSLAGGCSAAWLGALIAGAIGFSTMPAVQGRSPLFGSHAQLVAARSPAHAGRGGARHGVHHHARAQRPSSLEHATELAVSHGLAGP